MTALQPNQQITNFLERTSSQSSNDPLDDPEEEAPPAKRSRFGDPSITLTAAELRAATKEDLVAHIVALRKERKKAAKEDITVASLTPEQVTAKVDNARKMMVSGIKSQMKISPSLPSVSLFVTGLTWG
jgi:hypothetical protein